MRIIAIVNEKGGTAKSTTTVSLAAALGELGKRVLLVDLDGQAASSRWLGVDEDNALADAILRGGGLEPVPDVALNVDLAPASGKLDSVAHDLRPTQGGQLRKVLMEVSDRYDYVLIDCPPSLGNRLIGNALLAATHAIAPVETSVLALDGLRILLTMLEDIRDGFDHPIELIGVLGCRYDERVRLSRLVLAELHRALGDKVFKTVIRENKQLQECPASGTSILQYAPRSSASEDYRSLVRELVDGQAKEPELPLAGDLATDNELTNGDHLTVMSFRSKMSKAFGHGEPTDEATGQDLAAAEPDWTAPVTPGPVRVAQSDPQEADDLAQLQMAASATRRHPPRTVPNRPPTDDSRWDLPSAREPRRDGSTGKKVIAGSLIALMVALGFAARYFIGGPAESTANVPLAQPTARPAPPALPPAPEPPAPTAPTPEPTTPVDPAPPLAVVPEPTAPKPPEPTSPNASDPAGESPDPEDWQEWPVPKHMSMAPEPTAPDPAAPKAEPTTRPAPEPTTAPKTEPTTQPAPKPTSEPPAGDGATDTTPPTPNTQAGGTELADGGFAPVPTGFSLSCVLKSGKARWAIINGEIVEVGQEVKGAKVVLISPESVEMERDGKRFLLHIGGAGPKAPAGGAAPAKPSKAPDAGP